MKPQEVRVLNSDGVFSWQQFWEYFKSDRCTDEMRLWTMQHLNLLDCISGAMSQVQVEILRFAPVSILKHGNVQRLLSEDARRTLNQENNIHIWTQKDQEEFEEELRKYYRSQNKKRRYR